MFDILICEIVFTVQHFPALIVLFFLQISQ